MKTITMLELRQNSESIISSLKKGVSMILTYRGVRLAVLSPYESEDKTNISADPFFSICEEAVESPLGNLSSESEDSAIYEL